MEGYVRRLTELERLANGFAGVDRSYAIQSGREIRILVKPEEVDDRQASALADEIARRIEKELQYPGQIKVTVIRETRAQDVAK
jgi:ribonuclease Y